MEKNQNQFINSSWEIQLKEFYNDHFPEIRFQERLAGERAARDFLEQKLGQFNQEDVKQFLSDLNRDWWNDKIRKDRFMPAFYGSLANQITDSYDSFNHWSKRLWEADDESIPGILDEFWQKNEVAGAGTSLPTAILYLKNPGKYAIWIPILEQGLKAVSDFKTGKRRTANGYQTYNNAFQKIRENLQFPAQCMDILLALSAKKMASTQDTFAELFLEYVTTYMDSETGIKHLQRYEVQRKEARETFEKIKTNHENGKDIEEMVLLKCLPYADTQFNRKKDVWIHVAPSVTKDIKQWFEGAGWVKPDDWPTVANVIFEFINRCIDSPEKLSNHCQYFQQTCPGKGFQMGMLTPILNALNPEHYAIVNSKPRQVINYFNKSSYGNNLSEYPELNRTIFKLIKAHEVEIAELKDETVLGVDVFDTFSHWMVAVKKFSFKEAKVYKISPGEQASKWDQCVANGYISIGWDDLGDLSELSKIEFQKKRDELLALNSDWTQKSLNQVWQFANIKEGDRIIANKGRNQILGFGLVTGPYYFVPNTEYGHRLPVIWEDLTRRKVEETSWSGILQKINPLRYEDLKNAPPVDVDKVEAIIGQRNPSYSISECAKALSFEETEIERWIKSIHRKGQAIIYGPPGTGKTYAAMHIANHLIGDSYGFQRTVQFHPEYAYQDFMQGIRPITKDGAIQYKMVPGFFYQFCEEAKNKEGACVLIIDEINRANLSRVFGELMYLLEYRDEEIELAGGGFFKIPNNIRIIGTMNTADRSIALVDYALRRRFAFLKLEPKFDVLEKYHSETGFETNRLVDVLKDLNAQIADPNYEIGITFFLTENLEDEIEDIWQMEIEPYLEEYFFDDQEKFRLFRWENIRSRIQ